MLAEHLDAPVAQYLALHSSPVLRKHASQWAVASANWGEGMLRHLALSDEHYWFRCVMNGESQDYFPEGPNADFQLGPDETAGDVFALYRDEIAHADAIIAANSPDQPPRQPDPQRQQWGVEFPDLRTVMLWVIKETACHAGHLDAVRELIDGRQWIVL